MAATQGATKDAADRSRADGPGSTAGTTLQLRRERPDPTSDVTPHSQGQRLRQARIDAGFRTASEAAREFNIAGPTYLAHENGTRAIRSDLAELYAGKLNVTTEWLLFNKGSPSDRNESAARRSQDVRGSDPLMAEYGALLQKLGIRWDSGSYVGISFNQDAVDLPVLGPDPKYLPVLDVLQSSGLEQKVRVSTEDGRKRDLFVVDILPAGLGIAGRGRFFAAEPRAADPLAPGGNRSRYMIFDAQGVGLVTAERAALALAVIADQFALVLLQRDLEEKLTYSRGRQTNWPNVEDNAVVILGTAIRHLSDSTVYAKDYLSKEAALAAHAA